MLDLNTYNNNIEAYLFLIDIHSIMFIISLYRLPAQIVESNH